MASLVYGFEFGPSCAGLDAAVTDAYTGVAVAESPVELDSSGSAQVLLAEGSYNGLVSSADRGGIGAMSARGNLNVAASIEAAALLPEA